MLDFFLSQPSNVQYAHKKYPKWDWIKRNYTESINNLISYYNYRSTIVNNKHILTRIIRHTDPGIDLDLFSYIKKIETEARYVAKLFKLVNTMSNGTIFNNIFYSGKSLEIINQVEFNYDFIKVDKDYTAYSPLRVVYTEETDLDFHLLNGTKVKKTPSLTVLELDITLMLIMYRAWSKRRIKFGLEPNPNIFVSAIVIPNTIRTTIDHVIFNRFIYISKSIPIPDFKLKHKVYTLDYSRGVDDVLSRVADDMLNTNTPLMQFLETIPTLYYHNMYQALKLGRSLQTRQSLWSAWLSRVKYIDIIIDLIGPRGIKANTGILYTLPFDIRELRNGKTTYYDKLRENKSILEEYTEVISSIENKI